jgi:hypothetical protein
MHTTGTIYPDGRIQYHGYTPMKSRLLAINETLIVIHHPGGSYWDNGGEHYVNARIEVCGLAELRPGNAEGTWHFRLGGARGAAFHPTPAEAVKNAMWTLKEAGQKIVADIEKRNKES